MDGVRAAREIYASFGRGDIPAVLGAFESGIEWDRLRTIRISQMARRGLGRRLWSTKLFKFLGADWEGFTVSVKSLHDAGDYVVMEGRYNETYKPSGKKLDAQVCHVLRFSGGKLSSFQQCTDTAQIQAVMSPR